MLPAQILVNGKSFNLNSLRLQPMPGFPGWQMALANDGAALLVAWLQGLKLRGVTLFNLGAVDIVVQVDAKLSVSLSPASGYPLVADVLDLEYKSNKMDLWFDTIIAMGKVDQARTKDAGSGNMDFHLPPGQWASRWGFSKSAHRFFDEFRMITEKRARWRLDVNDAMPLNALHKYKDDVKNCWGLNPGDAHHADCLEIFWGFYLTRHPAYFWSLLNFVKFMMSGDYYWAKRETNDYYGSLRIPGWLLVCISLLVQAIDLLGDDAQQWASLRAELIAFGEWHVANLKKRHPQAASWKAGTGRKEVKEAQKDYYDSWMHAVAAWGLYCFGDACANKPALELAETFMEWLESWALSDGVLLQTISVDHTIKVPADQPGTGDWLAAPLVRRGKDTPLAKCVVGNIIKKWGMNPAKYEVAEHLAGVPGFWSIT